MKLGRIWPENLDFRPGLLVCGALFVIGAVALWFAKRHRVLVLLPLGAAIAFTVYLLGVYLPETSKHWSQKPLISKYYELRASPEEPLVAWQMFWHGETFYTSNDIYDGPKAERTVFLGKTNRADLKAFFGKQREKIFMVMEKLRMARLKRLVPVKNRMNIEWVDHNKFYLLSIQLAGTIRLPD